ADALGLPAPGLRASRACRSKYLQRWYVPEFSPASIVLPPGERDLVEVAGLDFPVVVKPASRHSSSGVTTVWRLEELPARFGAYGDHEAVLVEERVAGEEFSVESLVQHGKIIFASVTRKTTTDSGADTFVELSHTVPSERAGAAEVLLDANAALLA